MDALWKSLRLPREIHFELQKAARAPRALMVLASKPLSHHSVAQILRVWISRSRPNLPVFCDFDFRTALAPQRPNLPVFCDFDFRTALAPQRGANSWRHLGQPFRPVVGVAAFSRRSRETLENTASCAIPTHQTLLISHISAVSHLRDHISLLTDLCWQMVSNFFDHRNQPPWLAPRFPPLLPGALALASVSRTRGRSAPRWAGAEDASDEPETVPTRQSEPVKMPVFLFQRLAHFCKDWKNGVMLYFPLWTGIISKFWQIGETQHQPGCDLFTSGNWQNWINLDHKSTSGQFCVTNLEWKCRVLMVFGRLYFGTTIEAHLVQRIPTKCSWEGKHTQTIIKTDIWLVSFLESMVNHVNISPNISHWNQKS